MYHTLQFKDKEEGRIYKGEEEIPPIKALKERKSGDTCKVFE